MLEVHVPPHPRAVRRARAEAETAAAAHAAAIYFVLYGQLEGNVLAPLVYRRTVHVNPLVTLLAILFLAEFMGIAGAVLAVPVAAAAQIVVRVEGTSPCGPSRMASLHATHVTPHPSAVQSVSLEPQTPHNGTT